MVDQQSKSLSIFLFKQSGFFSIFHTMKFTISMRKDFLDKSQSFFSWVFINSLGVLEMMLLNTRLNEITLLKPH